MEFIIPKNFLQKVDDRINHNVITDSLFVSRIDTGGTERYFKSNDSKITDDTIVYEYPAYVDRIGGKKNTIVPDAIEKALDETDDDLWEIIFNNISKQL